MALNRQHPLTCNKEGNKMNKTSGIQAILRIMAYLSVRCREESSNVYADGYWAAGFLVGKAYNELRA
jgi:hypothetical protein